MRKYNFFITPILLLFIYSCGFKIADQSSFKNYEIKQIQLSGDKQINFKIKNKILSNIKKGNKKLITLKLNSKKKKSIKEKNIKNEITKYELVITIETKYFILDENKNIRDDLMIYLSSKGIETRPFFYPLHLQPALGGKYQNSKCKV